MQKTEYALRPEWAAQDWLWIGFPHDAQEWEEALPRAQEQIAAFANAVANSGQQVRLLVRDAQNEARAKALVNASVHLDRQVYGDIWLRDTGPIVVHGGRQSDGLSDGQNIGTSDGQNIGTSDGQSDAPRAQRIAKCFGFNGWGGQFVMEGDEAIGAKLAQTAGVEAERFEWILEGGAIDSDGNGLAVTTEQCLLNPNRNPDLSQGEIEARLAQNLGFERFLWLGEGLQADHTNGHVDNLARFIAPGTLAIPIADTSFAPRTSGSSSISGTSNAPDADDPNAHVFDDAARRAEKFGLTVHRIPSAGRVERDSQIQPASYMNFVITNHLVVVPIFGLRQDDAAVAALAALFPDRQVVGLAADAVLSGGGGFHCASMHMPSAISRIAAA